MKILVTGATGFIGRHVLNRLLEHGHECVGIARHKPDDLPEEVLFLIGDIADHKCLTGKIDDIEGVIHLAAREDVFMERGDCFGDRMFEVNVIGTSNLLKNLNHNRVKRIIVITSCFVNGYFGDGRYANENDCFNLTRFESTYLWSRYQTERLCLEFAAEGLPIILVEPTFIIGPGDSRPNFPGRMILEFLQGKTRIIPQGGSNWISIHDVSRGIVHLLETSPRYVRYLFGDENITYQEFYNLLSKIAGIDVPKFLLPHKLFKTIGGLSDSLLSIYGRKPGIPIKNMVKISGDYFYFDCSRAKEEGCYEGGNVTDAIEEAVEWFRSNKKV